MGKKRPSESLATEAERPLCAQWETWLGHPPSKPLPPLRIVLVLDNLAGHLSYDLVGWFAGPWGDAAVYADWRFLAQHGRVNPAHHRPPRSGWPASAKSSRHH